jgi:hypothetical protein
MAFKWLTPPHLCVIRGMPFPPAFSLLWIAAWSLLVLHGASALKAAETFSLAFETSSIDGQGLSSTALVQHDADKGLRATTEELIDRHLFIRVAEGLDGRCRAVEALHQAKQALLAGFSHGDGAVFRRLELPNGVASADDVLSCAYEVTVTAPTVKDSDGSWSRPFVRTCNHFLPSVPHKSPCTLHPVTKWMKVRGLARSFTLQLQVAPTTTQLQEEPASFLEVGVTAQGESHEAAQFPIPGLSTILKVFMKLLMAPVFDVSMEKMQDHLEHTMSETFSKDVGATVPKDLVALLAPDLTRNLTDLLTDTVPASVTQPLSTKLTKTLTPQVVDRVTTHVHKSLREALHNSLQELVSMKLEADIETALYRSLKTNLLPSLTRSLTHTIVPSLVHALKYRQAREPGASPYGQGIDDAVPISHSVAECLRKAAGVATSASMAAAASGGGGADTSSTPGMLEEMPVDLSECVTVAAATARHQDLYRSHFASDYYSEHYSKYFSQAGTLEDTAQFQVGEARPLNRGGK